MIGRKLKELLKSTNTKQIKLAEHAGISPSRLSNYLSEKREPDLELLAIMAKYLHVDLNYFVSGALHEATNEEQEMAGYVLTVPVVKTNATKPHDFLKVSSLFTKDAVVDDLIVFEIHEDIQDVVQAGDYIIAEKYSAGKAKIGDAILSGTNYYKLSMLDNKLFLISAKNKVAYFEAGKDYYIVRWLFNKA
ncbi:MAG: helix-turn-helix domain-containing protein [Deferribacteraceae bacterium]|jgi:transcriptional regulator with XRE-family HTH domain|nr:helix-turn-helix domain-containing protein [Deferribacteraceae bacterium]